MNSCIRGGGLLLAAGLTLLFFPENRAGEPPSSLTLDQAVQEAAKRSPVLQAQREVVEQARARVVTAKTYPNDPVLAFEGAQRKGPLETDFDREVRLFQVVQIGGQRGRQTRQSSAELEAVLAGYRREERLLAARVAAAFIEALRARELAEVEQANTDLARSLADVARKRFEAGAVPQMEVNLAQVQLGRAERDLRLTTGAYEVSRSVLAEIVGLDPTAPPEPLGELDLPPRKRIPLHDVVDGALRHRMDLKALRTSINANRAAIEVARRQVVPDLALELFYGQEEGTDRLLGGAIGVRIPLFNRNRGPIAEARSAERQAVAETEAATLEVRREVATARIRYRASAQAARDLEREVLGTLDENLRLLQRSFEAGKTSWTDVLVFRREFVNVQRDYVETVTDARLAAIELDLAAGIDLDSTSKESRP